MNKRKTIMARIRKLTRSVTSVVISATTQMRVTQKKRERTHVSLEDKSFRIKMSSVQEEAMNTSEQVKVETWHNRSCGKHTVAKN